MGRRKTAPKVRNPKYELVMPDQDKGIYEMLDSLIGRYHKSALEEAKILLAFEYDVKPDKDGNLRLWKIKVAGKLDRLLFPYDLVVLLNYGVWQDLAAHRESILDEALCAIVPELDKQGERKTDTKGRLCFHVRPFPIRAFPENHRRFGLWQEAFIAYVQAMATKIPPPEPGLFDGVEGKEKADKGENRQRTPAPYGGFVFTRPAKAGKALTEEAAREKIDRFREFAAKNNTGAAKATESALDEAGWLRQYDPAAEFVAAAAGAQ